MSANRPLRVGVIVAGLAALVPAVVSRTNARAVVGQGVQVDAAISGA